jgi:hypothetical protein
MWTRILVFGIAAGAIVGGQLVISSMIWDHAPPFGPLIGYLTMLVALSLVFVCVKQHRDVRLGGVIKFLPALGMGLAISIVASAVYAGVWEAVLAASGMDFAANYSQSVIEAARSDGSSEAEIAALTERMNGFVQMYSNPLIRFGISMSEMLPVGVVVSLVTAGLLRNSRFMPARRAAT